MPRRFHHGVTDSTNERAFAALEAGEALHLDLHVAHSQRAGRGRRGRAWVSAPGGGLYASFVLLPGRPIPPAALSVAGGLAVLDAVRALGLSGARLEWPNDVFVGDAKLAGILVETRGLDPLRPSYVLGVGLNVGQREFPAELVRERPVTSLALEGREVGVPEAERALTDRIADRIRQSEDDLERLAADFLNAADLAHHAVVAAAGEERWRGEVVSLSLVGGLRLRTASGEVRLALEHLRTLARG